MIKAFYKCIFFGCNIEVLFLVFISYILRVVFISGFFNFVINFFLSMFLRMGRGVKRDRVIG